MFSDLRIVRQVDILFLFKHANFSALISSPFLSQILESWVLIKQHAVWKGPRLSDANGNLTM